VLLLLFWMMNSAQGGGNRVLSFGKSKAKQLSKDMPKTTFADVAGADEPSRNCTRSRTSAEPRPVSGARRQDPKGVLLYGPGYREDAAGPRGRRRGRRAFYSISGSDFVEMFVGVGASRVRDLFEQAKPNAPASSS